MKRSTRVPQRVLIVGGSSEIGSALAQAWLRRGTEAFILTVRGPSDIDGLSQDIRERGRSLSTVHLDALDPSTIAQALDEAWSSGDLDVVVIALGLLGSQSEFEKDPSSVWEVLTVNATATIQIALDAARRMEGQQHGTILLLSSVAGMRGRRDNYVYGASKAALDTFAEGLQQRLLNSPVGVLIVRPGYVRSKMSAHVATAPFSVSIEESCRRILNAMDRGKSVVWIPSMLGPLFLLFRMLPRKLWATIVTKSR